MSTVTLGCPVYKLNM